MNRVLKCQLEIVYSLEMTGINYEVGFCRSHPLIANFIVLSCPSKCKIIPTVNVVQGYSICSSLTHSSCLVTIFYDKISLLIIRATSFETKRLTYHISKEDFSDSLKNRLR